jgi:hypothetical protein
VLVVVVGHAFRLALAGVVGRCRFGTFSEDHVVRRAAIRPAHSGNCTLLLTSLAVLSAWVPARRASRIDPMDTPREE